MNSTYFKYILVLIFLKLLSCQDKNIDTQDLVSVENDSISFYIKKASDKKTEKALSKQYFQKAYLLNNLIKNDSIRNKNLLDLAYKSYRKRHNTFFKKTNNEAQYLSTKLSYDFGIGDTHWNLGNYYNKFDLADSAYYHYSRAEEYFVEADSLSKSGIMLYNMAVIQGKIKDYTGSEVLTMQAISKFKSLGDKDKNLYRCYNHLGVLLKNLEEYKRSVFYYNKALEYLEAVEDKATFEQSTLSNLGLVYHTSGDYKQAIQYFQKALTKENLKTQNSILYAKLIDNLAYSKFLDGDLEGLEQEFRASLNIRDSINNASGIIISKLHLAEFHTKKGDTSKAIELANASNSLAKKINNNRDFLASLKLLSKIDKVNSATYLNNYVELGDRLQKEERKTREKFTRIRFETDEYVEETERLSQQKIWMMIIGAVSFMTLSLLYFFLRQRSRNKELVFETKQQAYNEEVYKLMLKQEASLKKGRLDERNRISEELHDGVLSKLFGTRMGIGFLKLKGDDTTLKQHKQFINELQEAEKEIRLISHELKNDVLETEVNFLNLIENLLNKQSLIGQFDYKVSSNSNIEWDDIDEKVKIHLYRIIQEGLTNITKYSKAKNVSINFSLKDKLFILTVEDDGVGFDKLKNKKGIGLSNMKSRTRKLMGNFSVDSIINNGTKLTVSIKI